MPDPQPAGSTLRSRIDRARFHLAGLRDRARERHAADPLLQESLSALETLIEELQVGDEELRAQAEARAVHARSLERERYRDLFEFAPDAYVVTDLRGGVRAANQAALRLFATTGEAVRGEPLATFVCAPERRRFRACLARLAAGEPVADAALRVRRPGGEARAVSCSAVPGHAVPGESPGLLWLMRDVTERKHLEARAHVLERITDGFLALDAHGRFTYVNRRAEELMLRPRELLLGRSAWEVFPEAVERRVFELYREVMRGGEPRHVEETIPELGRCFELHLYPGDGLSVYFRDVTERHRAQEELRRAKEEAEAAVRQREEILSVVSHDLKNPLQAIQLQATMLGDMPLGEAAHGEAVRSIQRTTETMVRLIQGLLDVGRLGTGHALPVAPERVEVEPLLADACALFEPQVRVKQLRLEYAVNGRCPPVRADPDRLLQVLWNLLGNAVKFTPDGGRVEVRAESGGEVVRFGVRDTGPGIPPEELPLLFEPYWQARSAARLGTGIGLAISKALVEAHGGAIDVRSVPGEGTTVAFTLPAAS